MVDLSLVSLRRVQALLSLNWDEVEDAIAEGSERELHDIRGSLEKVLDWFGKKADTAATTTIVFVLSRLLEKL